MIFLLGIDDTGPTSAVDTPALALMLGEKLTQSGTAQLLNISVHQFLRHPEITFTSKNTACCLMLEGDPIRFREIDMESRNFLRSTSSSQANPGFALASWKNLNQNILIWGKSAQNELLERQNAIILAKECGLSIAGFAGSGNGVIGALAAIGLRFHGSDGCLCWMPGLKNLQGDYSLSEIFSLVRVDRIENERGIRPVKDDVIHIEGEVLPILEGGKSVLLLKRAKRSAAYQWELDKRRSL